MTIAILSALAQEQHGLLERLQQPVRVSRGGRDFWRGQWHGHDVVLALSNIGKVAAATTSTALIEAFAVRRVVFTGVAGGIGAGVQVGDVVVAHDFVQHDMDASPLFARYQVPLYGRTRFACDPALTALLLGATTQGLAGLKATFALNPMPFNAAIHSGLIASGDRFISSATEVQALQTGLQAAELHALAVEMEGAAVAQVCLDYGVPFAAVRTISDRADDQAHVDFPKFVTEVASRYALAIIEQLMTALPQR